MAQEIQRQLEEIEVKQKELEFKGVNVEKALRNKNRKLYMFLWFYNISIAVFLYTSVIRLFSH